MGLDDYGLEVGARADLVALACAAPQRVLAEQPARTLVRIGAQQPGYIIDQERKFATGIAGAHGFLLVAGTGIK